VYRYIYIDISNSWGPVIIIVYIGYIPIIPNTSTIENSYGMILGPASGHLELMDLQSVASDPAPFAPSTSSSNLRAPGSDEDN
jgi:hypothetical protein